ncbi:DUF2096 domain-containing protein [Methanobrevibacter sp. OttesenSCG-928-K11]|nr:DUF2096 domain-containing protein [Methanobrevibacter sp. OttesenSCG-928-K11]MDL2271204.1 DUF2096 domain-containing protein [Methanobrevibacter sp. OttesenSCG-928-I08]
MSLPSEQNWLIIVNLLTDLKKKGYAIPNSINKDIGLARSSINFYKRDPNHPDMINELARANMVLTEVQEHLLDMANDVSSDYFNKWFDEFKRVVQGEEVYTMPESNSKFLINTPPGMSAGRINLKNPLAEERVQEIAEYNGIIIEFDDDKTVALYGDKSDVQSGIKEMASFVME